MYTVTGWETTTATVLSNVNSTVAPIVHKQFTNYSCYTHTINNS
jgi:hypothetical protein